MYALKLTQENLSGNEMIDKDHQTMMDICNELFETQKHLGVHEQVDELLRKLLRHLEHHFLTEEELHRETGYAKAKTHENDHRDLLFKTRGLMSKHKNGILSFGDLYRFINMEVVKGHLEVEDRDFHRFIKS